MPFDIVAIYLISYLTILLNLCMGIKKDTQVLLNCFLLHGNWHTCEQNQGSLVIYSPLFQPFSSIISLTNFQQRTVILGAKNHSKS